MREKVKDFILITVGCVVAGVGTALFLLPNKLSSGGFAGIATIFYYFLKIPMGTSIIVMNIPLFIISYFRSGKGFLIKSIYATFLYSEMIDVLSQIETFTEDKFLDSIYGGILIGIAEAITITYISSTFSDALVFGILIFILLVKPAGLFGVNVREKV